MKFVDDETFETLTSLQEKFDDFQMVISGGFIPYILCQTSMYNNINILFIRSEENIAAIEELGYEVGEDDEEHSSILQFTSVEKLADVSNIETFLNFVSHFDFPFLMNVLTPNHIYLNAYSDKQNILKELELGFDNSFMAKLKRIEKYKSRVASNDFLKIIEDEEMNLLDKERLKIAVTTTEIK